MFKDAVRRSRDSESEPRVKKTGGGRAGGAGPDLKGLAEPTQKLRQG